MQNDQERYVESAWRQVGDVLAANRLRRRAEYSLATSIRIYRRWLVNMPDGDLLTATAPVHAKVGVADELKGRSKRFLESLSARSRGLGGVITTFLSRVEAAAGPELGLAVDEVHGSRDPAPARRAPPSGSRPRGPSGLAEQGADPHQLRLGRLTAGRRRPAAAA